MSDVKKKTRKEKREERIAFLKAQVPDETAQDIIKLPQEKYIVAGARMFARALNELCRNEKHPLITGNLKNLKHFISFLDGCNRDELEYFIYGYLDTVSMRRCGTGKHEWRVTKIHPDRSSEKVNPHDFLPDDEQRYRTLCRILLDALINTASFMSAMSGRDADEILNQMVLEVNRRSRDLKIEVKKNED